MLAVYVRAGGLVGCKAGLPPQHLALRRADSYDGLVLCVSEVYTERCTSVIRRNICHHKRDALWLLSLAIRNVWSMSRSS